MVPPLASGLLLSLGTLAFDPGPVRWLFVLPNVLFYACAAHAAGFFMPRGMKLFGWLSIVLTGVVLLVTSLVAAGPSPRLDHAIMGTFFGVLHLAYGVYLYVTELRKNIA
jgi:hypothetical protein